MAIQSRCHSKKILLDVNSPITYDVSELENWKCCSKEQGQTVTFPQDSAIYFIHLNNVNNKIKN